MSSDHFCTYLYCNFNELSCKINSKESHLVHQLKLNLTLEMYSFRLVETTEVPIIYHLNKCKKRKISDYLPRNYLLISLLP